MTDESSFPFLPEERPYIIAEAGGNHGGNVEEAKEYVRAAADAGADAIKFQFYRGAQLIVADEPPLPQISDDYDSQQERFRDLELDRTEWKACADLAADLHIDFAASAFDPEMADLAAELGPFVKIASGDLTYHSLLDYVDKLGRPVILSTGCATGDEIRAAVERLSRARLVLLHCVSSYPTPESDANLHFIDHLRETFDVPVGYSDHTTGIQAATAAAATGARIIEKHLSLGGEGGDHALSATPAEMEKLVARTKKMAALRGGRNRSSTFDSEDNCGAMRRSLAPVRDLKAGEELTVDDLTALRPERGIAASAIDDVVGRKVTRDVGALTILQPEDLS